jgi:hypothetical protein
MVHNLGEIQRISPRVEYCLSFYQELWKPQLEKAGALFSSVDTAGYHLYTGITDLHKDRTEEE